jgi:hypothetical protein
MAKKRRKEEVEEEKYEFVPPDFDEKAFLKKDLGGTETLLVTAVLAVVFGIIAYIAAGVSPLLGLVVLIAGIILLRYIYRLLRIGSPDMEFKTLGGNIVLFFFLGLGIWILMMNPPVSDNVAPQVGAATITPAIVHVGEQFNITANITDNGAISSVQITAYLSGSVPGALQNMAPDTSLYPHAYRYTTSLTAAGNYLYDIVVIDTVGHETKVTKTFQVLP